MIVLPLLLNDITTNILIDFKEENISKIDNQLTASKPGVLDSDIIVGKVNLKALINNEKMLQNPRAITNFIRKNVNYSNREVTSILVNTKKYDDSDFYTTYKLPLPPKDPNEVVDYLYGSLVNNVRQSTPSSLRKEKISLNAIGFDKLINIEFLNRVVTLKGNSNNSLYLKDKLISEGYKEQVDILEFFNSLEYKIGDNGIVLTDEINNIIDFFGDTYKEKKTLINYKNMALNNSESYICLSAFNNYIYGWNLNWIIIPEEKQKILIRKLNSVNRAA